MEKKWIQKIIATAIAAVMLFAAACGSAGTPASAEQTAAAEAPASADPVPACGADADPTYTYRFYLGASPLTWNPHTWELDSDFETMWLLQTPLWDIIMSEDGEGWEWLFEEAESYEDITAAFADKERWGVPADAAEGHVFQINLRQDLKWCDGTPINAESYVSSAKLLLDPQLLNYRASALYHTSIAPVNSFEYFFSGKAGQPRFYEAWTAEDAVDAYYFNPAAAHDFLWDYSLHDWVGYEEFEYDGDGVNRYEKYEDLYDFIEITDEVKADLLVFAANFGDDDPGAWLHFAHYIHGVYEEVDWEDVGFFVNDEYSFIMVTKLPNSAWDIMYGLWHIGILVHEETYTAGMHQVGGLMATSYGTSLETTRSHGPYRMISYEIDKQAVYERNPYWYGWNDPRYENWYQATHYVIDIVPDHGTALQLFNQGLLDYLLLVSDDMVVYRFSDYLLRKPSSETARFIFATSLESLIALENEAGDGANKRVLHYSDFRRGFSLAIDRSSLVMQATAGALPQLFLFNDMYYYDISNDPASVYRNSVPAMEAAVRMYGLTYGPGEDFEYLEDAYHALTGYDVEAAREAFQAAYIQAVSDGNYTDGQPVQINVMATGGTVLTADQIRRQDMMNDFITDATIGTGFEGMINITYQFGAPNRYADLWEGRQEVIMGSWFGGYLDVFNFILNYVCPEYAGGMHQLTETNGWDPTGETITIAADFYGNGSETLTRTFTQWARDITAGGEFSGNVPVSLIVMAELEMGVLESYQAVPILSATDIQMRSMKVEYGTYDFNPMYEYGYLRMVTFNYTDAEWAAFVAAQGGTLNYE
ncbi:MAG: ABC transporter substrate-binding protein [Defluviitaleaceae bacterium]|nr:ABC transporter substrate-binding protein [Defluviitaleaceae bacterium]MCL2836114.1 ABC transporter substrate-binding protein [Defluviitaleaceae bacterium]